MPRTGQREWGYGLWAMAAGAGLALGGCRMAGSTQAPQRMEQPQAPALTAAAPASTPAWAATQPINIAQIIDRAAPEEPAALPAGVYAAPTQSPPSDPQTPAAPLAEGAKEMLTLDAGNTGPSAPPGAAAALLPAPVPQRSLVEQIDDTAIVLMGLVAQQTADPATAWKAYLALAALDLVRPGSMPQVISPDQRGAAVLSPEELATADTVRQFLADMAAIPPEATPQARSAKIAELADKIAAAAPMRITTTALCGRVTGFGQYIPLDTSKLMQGRPQRAIVYTEVANFGHRAAGEQASDRWIVELSQSLQLFHDADGTLAWSRPEEPVLDASRNKRRDFYLVNDITLPPTLTIGAYRMKIIMRDRITDQTDEAVIPIEVVADPTLALQPNP